MGKEEVKIGKEVLEGQGGDSFKGGLLLLRSNSTLLVKQFQVYIWFVERPAAAN